MSGRFRMPLIVASLLLACGVATVTARTGNSDAANRPAGYRLVDFRTGNRNAVCPTQRFSFDNHFPHAAQWP